MPCAARNMIGAQLVQCLELLLYLLQLLLALFVHLGRLLLKDLLDLGLQAAHIVPVVLLNDLLELSFLALQLGLTYEVFAHFDKSAGFSGFFCFIFTISDSEYSTISTYSYPHGVLGFWGFEAF